MTKQMWNSECGMRGLLGKFALAVFIAMPAAMLQAQEFGAEDADGQQPQAELKPAEPAAPIIPDDPVVRAVIESRPRTPAELIRAADTLARLDQAELGRSFLKQWLGLPEVPDEAKADLVRQFGNAFLIRLATDAQLAPEGRQVADAIFQGADAYARDPQRLESLIKQLSDPAVDVRRRATRDLLAGGEAAIQALIAVLADPARNGEHAVVRQTLAHFGAAAHGPLLGVLESPDRALNEQAILVLASIADREIALYLLAPATSAAVSEQARDAARAGLQREFGKQPSTEEAEQLLYQYANDYFADKRPLRRQGDSLVSLWHWDPATRQVAVQQYTPEQATVVIAARLAKDLHELAPENPLYKRLYLISTLEAAVHRQGLDQPLPTGEGTAHDIAAAYGPAALEEVLSYALETGHLRAATAAAQLLGEVGDPELLAGHGGSPRPLVRALQSGDRRLKFAALEAVMKLRPDEAFAGSSNVTDAIEYFANSTGEPYALVAHPNPEPGQRLAGLMAQEGYETVSAVTGHGAVKAALESPDIELILLSAAIDRPAIAEVVQALRADQRTKDLPIAILLEEHHTDDEPALAETDELVIRFPRPVDPASAEYLINKMVDSAAGTLVTADIRAQQAEQAIEYAAELSELDQTVFSLRKLEPVVAQALFQAGSSPAAAKALSNLGTHESQVALLDLASLTPQPLEIRKAAAEAFAASVQRFGTRLTSGEIMRQYDRYNASAALDAPTQQMLGSILDVLEGKTMKAE